MSQFFALLTDITIGAAALKVAWSADRATAKLSELLNQLTSRIEALEDKAPRARVVKRKKGRGI